MPAQRPRPRHRAHRRWGLPALLLAATLGGSFLPATARAETVMERAARTGVITLGGRTDVVPYAFKGPDGRLVGYSLDVARLIEAEVSRYLNRPVRLEFVAVEDPARLFRQVNDGEVDLACGAQFTWEREMFVDFSIPFSLSGIRVLTRKGGPDGTPASLAGRRLAVVPGSLGEAAVKVVQPKAVRVPVASLAEGIAQLAAGRVDGVAGDSVVLASTAQQEGRRDLTMVPAEAYARYAVGCILPENNSTFRNLVNLALAQMIQGYVNGDASSRALVNRWLGPEGPLGLPPEVIQTYFQTVLLNHEQIRLPAAAPAAPSDRR